MSWVLTACFLIFIMLTFLIWVWKSGKDRDMMGGLIDLASQQNKMLPEGWEDWTAEDQQWYIQQMNVAGYDLKGNQSIIIRVNGKEVSGPNFSRREGQPPLLFPDDHWMQEDYEKDWYAARDADVKLWEEKKRRALKTAKFVPTQRTAENESKHLHDLGTNFPWPTYTNRIEDAKTEINRQRQQIEKRAAARRDPTGPNMKLWEHTPLD
jgi:hypothetical protein